MPSSRLCCSLQPGIVIDALEDEHNIFRMGGLRTRLPVANLDFFDRWMFARRLAANHPGPSARIGLSGAPPAQPTETPDSRIIALAGVLLTSLYTFRMIFLVFFGEARSQVTKGAGIRHANSVPRAGVSSRSSADM